MQHGGGGAANRRCELADDAGGFACKMSAQTAARAAGRRCSARWGRAGVASCVLALCLVGLRAARAQRCEHDYIAWPREQCTQPCPIDVKCSYNTVRTVKRYAADYCCLCVGDGQGSYQAYMCAGSANPPPAARQVPYNATIDQQEQPVLVRVPEGDAVPTLYVHLSSALIRDWKDPMTYLEVKVAALSEIPPSNTTVQANANASGTRSTGPGVATQGPPYQVLSAQGADRQPQLLVGGALARRDSAEPAPAAALYACKGLHGGQTRYVDSDEPVQLQPYPAPANADGLDASQRRGAPSVNTLEWYLLDGGAPQVDLPVPFFLFQGKNAGQIPILKARSRAPEFYVMGLRGVGAAYQASVEASLKPALKLQDAVRTTVSLQANGRVFTYYRPPRGVAEGLLFLDIKVDQINNATVSLYVGVNFLSTAREWVKWVGGQDHDMDNMPDRFFTSNLMVVKSESDYTSWTLESSLAATWSVMPRVVTGIPLLKDSPRNFEIDTELGIALFTISPKVNQSRLFFQIMPSTLGSSRKAYKRWEDLQDAVRIMASTKVNGDWAYFQLSDWGYTTDGTPGLQVMVSQWDAGATVYLHVYLRNTAPSPSFTIVCYLVDSALEQWEWWFAGLFFALFVFCVARCVLCRPHARQYLLGRRNMGMGRRDESMGPGGSTGGIEMRPVVAPATTTEPPPSKLKKVGDTLYSRSTDSDAAQQQASIPAGPVGPILAQGEAADADEDDLHSLCFLCMDRQPDAILLECGHGGLCMACAQSLWDAGPEGRLCPMCRKAITGVVKIVGEVAGGEVNVEVVCYSLAPPASERPSFLRRMMGGRQVGEAQGFVGGRQVRVLDASPNWSSSAELGGGQPAAPNPGAPVLTTVEVRNPELSSLETVRPSPPRPRTS